MMIGGFQKFTLIDFPGKIAATVFTAGCNFRCHFCHNPELVDLSLGLELKPEKEFFDFMERRKGKLDGVCITGGEPTIQPDILDFMRKIKSMGFAVKLDSNGTNPDVLRAALDENLLDYIAMDIKNQLKKYDLITGVGQYGEKIEESAGLIMGSEVPYEFRTTVVPGLHEDEDFFEIARWLEGSKAYYLQEYREDYKILNLELKDRTRGKKIDLEKIKKMIEGSFGTVGIRR